MNWLKATARLTRSVVLLALALACAALQAEPTASIATLSRIKRGEPIIGQIALSFHVASAAVVRAILERGGVKTITREAPHEDMYAMLARGEVDILVSVWLPGSHGVYVEPIERDLIRLGVLYEPYAIWGVSGELSTFESAGMRFATIKAEFSLPSLEEKLE